MVAQKTLRGIGGEFPTLEVIHTAEDDWLAGDGVSDPNATDAVTVTAMTHLVEADPSLSALASLRCGEIAQRDSIDAPWRISIHEWAEPE